MRKWLDRVLVGGALLLVAGVAAQGIASWLEGRDDPEPPAKGLALGAVEAAPDVTFTTTLSFPDAAPTGEGERVELAGDVPLHSSPETQFLPRCSFRLLHYDVARGQRLRMRYAGPPCRPPEPLFDAVVRDPQGRGVRRVPALDVRGTGLLAAHVAGRTTVAAPLASGLLRCRSGRPDRLRPIGQGASVTGTIPCRAQR